MAALTGVVTNEARLGSIKRSIEAIETLAAAAAKSAGDAVRRVEELAAELNKKPKSSPRAPMRSSPDLSRSGELEHLRTQLQEILERLAVVESKQAQDETFKESYHADYRTLLARIESFGGALKAYISGRSGDKNATRPSNF